MRRKRFSERDVIATLINQGMVVRCFRCVEPFITVAYSDLGLATELWNRHHVSNIEREHVHEIALGGKDEPENCRYSCRWSHSQITNGTKATSAGSSKQRIAKVKRLRGETCTGPKKKIQSRGFDKTQTRKMDGSVVLR